ncbi:VanZ family protein [Streptococcus ovuberis]|uniref:VanZ family protein n=1 Tax=Streptococcus ovuberis TaxID=1936207 RepID=A0A7X6MZP9_9STRE|nr:VanZ family protein [Streptococcus ovuberis]NKZ20383.1 VanZ family protein [Streptococcus ovuberis]
MKRSKRLISSTLALYLLVLIWLILFKLALGPYELPRMRSLNLIPFAQSQNWDGSLHIKEIVANVLVFLPFGLLVKRHQSDWSVRWIVGLGLGLSFLLESLQYLLATGASDLTDVLTNGFGVLMGVGLYGVLTWLLPPKYLWLIEGLVLVGCLLAVFLVIYLKSQGNWIWHYL